MTDSADTRPTTEAGQDPRTEPRHVNGSGWTRDGSASRTPAPRSSTSVAAVFALVLGLIAFLAALTGLLAPVAVVLGIVGLVLGIVGTRAGGKPGKAGKGVAIGGLVLSVLALLLGLAAIIGLAGAVSSNPQILDQITQLVDNARSEVPTG